MSQMHTALCKMNEVLCAHLEVPLQQSQQLADEATAAKLKHAEALLTLMLEMARAFSENILKDHESDKLAMMDVFGFTNTFHPEVNLCEHWQSLSKTYRDRVTNWCSDVRRRFAEAAGCRQEVLTENLFFDPIEACYALLAIAAPHGEEEAKALRTAVDVLFSGLEVELLVSLALKYVEGEEIEQRKWSWENDGEVLQIPELELGIPKKVVQYLAELEPNDGAVTFQSTAWITMLNATAPSQRMQQQQQQNFEARPQKKMKFMNMAAAEALSDVQLPPQHQPYVQSVPLFGKRQMRCSHCGQKYKTTLEGTYTKSMWKHLNTCSAGTFVFDTN